MKCRVCAELIEMEKVAFQKMVASNLTREEYQLAEKDFISSRKGLSEHFSTTTCHRVKPWHG